jgi:hypothetical protein
MFPNALFTKSVFHNQILDFFGGGTSLTCVARCFGSVKHASILKKAASGVAGGLRPLAVGEALRKLASILVLHKALLFAADYPVPHKSPQLPRQGQTFLYMDSARSWSSLGMIRTRLR